MQVVQQNDGEILQNNVGTSSIESENQPQSDTTTQGNGGGWWPFGRKAQQPSLMFGKRKKEDTNQRVANNLLSANTYAVGNNNYNGRVATQQREQREPSGGRFNVREKIQNLLGDLKGRISGSLADLRGFGAFLGNRVKTDTDNLEESLNTLANETGNDVQKITIPNLPSSIGVANGVGGISAQINNLSNQIQQLAAQNKGASEAAISAGYKAVEAIRSLSTALPKLPTGDEVANAFEKLGNIASFVGGMLAFIANNKIGGTRKRGRGKSATPKRKSPRRNRTAKGAAAAAAGARKKRKTRSASRT